MANYYWYCDCILLLIDTLVICNLRRFLLDFLIGCRNKKVALRIHKEQAMWERLTLSYMEPYLKRYVQPYKKFQSLYARVLYTLVPQYFILLICNFCIKEKSLYVLAMFVIIKLVVDVVVRSHQDASLVSIYRKKH